MKHCDAEQGRAGLGNFLDPHCASGLIAQEQCVKGAKTLERHPQSTLWKARWVHLGLSPVTERPKSSGLMPGDQKHASAQLEISPNQHQRLEASYSQIHLPKAVLYGRKDMRSEVECVCTSRYFGTLTSD